MLREGLVREVKVGLCSSAVLFDEGSGIDATPDYHKGIGCYKVRLRIPTTLRIHEADAMIASRGSIE